MPAIAPQEIICLLSLVVLKLFSVGANCRACTIVPSTSNWRTREELTSSDLLQGVDDRASRKAAETFVLEYVLDVAESESEFE